MKKAFFWILLITLLAALAACSPTPTPAPTLESTATSAPTDTPEPSATAAPSATSTETVTPTPAYPLEGYGPSNFPAAINPLTGLKVEDPSLLDRRPILIKVENLPRRHRPQSGVSLADIVYEYYTEQGSTRFSVLFYGQDAEKVTPIRSARFLDINLIRMYKSIFVFGSAYETIYARLVNSDFSNRLILEGPGACPAVCRVNTEGDSTIVADTHALQDYLVTRNVDNSRQNLDGMLFKLEPPDGGGPASQVFTRFSGAIYNRWDYDAASGKYLRFSDAADDINNNNPKYEQLTDALTKKPIAVENVVVLYVRHTDVDLRPEVEVLDVSLLGSGPAYVARDGKVYEVKWSRMAEDQVVTLINEDGSPFPYKPGQTWVEVFALNSTAKQEGDAWRFAFGADW